jgi:hydroxymethylbilane synthase
MASQTLIRIGTRRSALARWQAEHVRRLLGVQRPDLRVELVPFTTRGDRLLDRPLPEIGGKGLFTQELEEALLAREIDLAVHSLKDLPTGLAESFVLGAILPRANPFDALISHRGCTLATLPPGATVGTSSLRRSAQLRAHRPDLRTESLRGNVDTRLRKALDPGGPYDAIVLAAAGLDRLGRSDAISEVLDPAIMLPAPGQGALAVQCRAGDARTLEALAPLDDAATRSAVTAERAFLHRLDAGCRLPVSAYARLEAGDLRLTGRVSAIDGTRALTVQGSAALSDAFALGVQLADRALAQGAEALLDALRGELSA